MATVLKQKPTTEWPDGIGVPVDCVRIVARDTLVLASDIIWNNRDNCWDKGSRVDGCTWGRVRDHYDRWSACARSIHSRENPPDPPAGYELLKSTEWSIGDARQYVVGRGWGTCFGVHRLEDMDQTILAVARKPDTSEPTEPPRGFERLTKVNPHEDYNQAIHRVWSHGRWLAVVFNAELGEIEGFPLAIRKIPVSDLPITRVSTDTIVEVGDFTYDSQARKWVPFVVNPSGLSFNQWLSGAYIAFARLNEEFRDKPLLAMQVHINAGHEVFSKRSGAWAWGPPLESDLNKTAYLIDEELLAVRQGPVASPEKPRVGVDGWMDNQMRSMLETDADSEVFRGLVRRNYHLNIPADLHASGDVKAITRWMEERYAELHPYKEVTEVRVVWQRIKAETGVPVDFSIKEHSGDDMGSVYGTAKVPREVFDQGEEAVRCWVLEQYPRYVEDGEGDDIIDPEWATIEYVNYTEAYNYLHGIVVAVEAVEPGDDETDNETDDETDDVG